MITKIADMLLWPGTKICQWFGVDPVDDQGGLIRAMFNMLVYLIVLLTLLWMFVW